MANPPMPAPPPAAPATIADMIAERDAAVKPLEQKLSDFGKKKAAGDPGDWDAAIADLMTQIDTLNQAAAKKAFSSDELKEAVAALKIAGKDLSDEAKKLPDATTYLKNVTAFTDKVGKVASLVKNGVTKIQGG